ncbi:hypothetical protein TELCIR_08698 [Teladorsagia circumcincta]|uniref:Uncharacterized protein n=1 Tax=Teladorsagia circumcincta TaxID=45464 RepID=A0A2G9UGV6_TELCI|nr:hypothetical protein TELCIR_08698 [Teladorsagia circumcincta]
MTKYLALLLVALVSVNAFKWPFGLFESHENKNETASGSAESAEDGIGHAPPGPPPVQGGAVGAGGAPPPGPPPAGQPPHHMG